MTLKNLTPDKTPDFAKGDGTISAIAQDYLTGAVLMTAAMNEEAYNLTLSTGEMHYTSRTRGLWHKGATSGNTQRVITIQLDCDNDALLAQVIPTGPACHRGDMSCFGTAPATPIERLAEVIEQRADTIHETPPQAGGDESAPPHASYTSRLLQDENLRLKKIGEEGAELVAALAKGDVERATDEGADIIYHTLVALRSQGITLTDVQKILERRAG